jgi:ribonuclease HI
MLGTTSKQRRKEKSIEKTARLNLKRETRKKGAYLHIRLMVYSDGGARGNPGPAAIAFLILTEKGQVVKKQSRCLGVRTNNQAEYEALIAALESAAAIGAEELICHLDSEVVAKHLTGEYKVKNAALKQLWNRAQELKKRFKKVSFVNVPRTDRYIQEADRLVNEALDEASK